MTQYIIRRLLILPLTIVGVTILIFGMISFLTPEARSSLYVRDIPKNQAAMEGIIRQYGLRDPIYVQYWHWLIGRKNSTTGEYSGGILRGDLGYSRTMSQPVLIHRQSPLPGDHRAEPVRGDPDHRDRHLVRHPGGGEP